MDAVLLTWRWQNILSIWLMVILLYLLTTVGMQAAVKQGIAKDNANG